MKASVLKMDVVLIKTAKVKKKKIIGKMKLELKSLLSIKVINFIIGGKRFAINNLGLQEKLNKIELLYNLVALILKNI